MLGFNIKIKIKTKINKTTTPKKKQKKTTKHNDKKENICRTAEVDRT